MEKLALCRICLTSNVSSINIINHELQEIYHKLTSLAFKTEDRRPHLVCCFCKSLLRKALSLKIDSLAAERVFSHILDSEDLSLIDFDIPANCSFPRLRKETQQSVSIDTACEELTGQIADSDLGKIKHEVIDENDPLSECDDNEDELALIDFDQKSSKVGVKKESGSNKYEKFSYTKRRKGQVADELPPVNIDDECLKGVKAESELNIYEVSPHSKLSIEIAVPFAGKGKLDPIHTEPYSYQESDDIEPHQSKEYKCHLCPRTYRFQSALKRHILMHTGERPFKCGNCHRTFAENSNMLKHIRNRHPEVVSFTCHKCHKVFKDSASLKEHRLTHTGDGAHKCDICQKGFKRKTQLKEHLLTHGPKPYMCDHCQKRFKNRNFLQNHVRIAHTQEKRYKCDKCHLAFKQSHQLKVHKYTHAGKKPYKCDLCEKDFSYKGVLINHMKIHSGEKPFKCDKCWKDFRQLAQLTTHIRIHSGVRPYKCKMCMKSFKQQSDMKKHARIHTGERPYKCDVCGRDFVQRHACVIHMRSHTGEKPYHCSVCQKSFICHSRLKRHSMVHTGDRPYNCHLCEKEFKEKPTLRRHIRRVHNTEMNQNKLKNVL